MENEVMENEAVATAPTAAEAAPAARTERSERPARPAQRNNRRRKKVCAFCADKVEYFDYKDTVRLRKYVSERAYILPRRISGTCAKHQRELTLAIKRARHMALMPYISD